jgi:hypothetical protein
MRYYLGQCEFKWTHANTQIEKIWVQRELGEELYKIVETNDWKWTLMHSDSISLPGDMYCRCNIYVEIPNSKQATHFLIKYPRAKQVEKII